jgi:PAS domain S-box-containing protein
LHDTQHDATSGPQRADALGPQRERYPTDERFRDYFDQTLVGMVVATPDMVFVEANEAACGLLGFSRAELLGRSWADLTHPDDKDADLTRHRGIMSGQSPDSFRFEKRFVRKDGGTLHADLSLRCLRTPDGDVDHFLALFSDITERKAAEAALRESEARYRGLFEHSPFGAAVHEIVLDDAGRPVDYVFLEANPVFETATGLRTADILGRRVTEVLPGIEDSPFIEVYGRVALSGEPATFVQYSEPLGRTYSVTAYSVGGGRFATLFDDVTERRRLEEELDDERQRFRQLVEHSGEAFLLSEPHGVIHFANAEACRMFGRTEEEIRAVGRRGLVDPTDPRLAASLDAKEQTGSFTGELRFVRGDGTVFPGEISTNEFVDHRSHLRTSTVVRDLTAAKQAEAALIASETKYRAVADETFDWEWWLGPDGRYTYVSPACERISGHKPEEFLADPGLLLRITHPDDAPVLQAHLEASLVRSVLDGRLRFRILKTDGTERVIEHVCKPVFGADGTYLGRRGSNRDVTEQCRAEAEVRQLATELEERVRSRTAQLEAMNHELETFSYSVSHDLRAPLRAIDGFSQIVLEDAGERLTDEEVHHLQRVREAAQRMAVLIDGLLGLSRLGRKHMDLETVDVSAVAGEILHEFRDTQPDRLVDCMVAAGLTARADPVLLRVILTNLLGNAWKFTSRHATARIEVGARDLDGERVFYVRDDGAGFDQEKATNLFGAFQRMHTPESFEGSGIGLATVQRLVARHGGRVWAEAHPEEGATFFFTLQEPGTQLRAQESSP